MKHLFNALKISVVVFSIPLLVNCATTVIDNLDAFKSTEAEMAEIAPSAEELEGKKTKIAVYDIENVNDVSKRAQVGEKLTEQIKKYLLEANIELIDRAATEKYKDEIILASQESGEFTGPKFASYVVQGKISGVTFAVTLGSVVSKSGVALQALAYYNNKKSNAATSEEKCRYNATISGSYTLYSLPELTTVKQFLFSDTENLNIEPKRAIESGGDLVSTLFTGKVPGSCPVNQNIVEKLVSGAANESIRKGRIEIQNLFAPKGYIERVHFLDDKYIAKITIGKNANLKEGGMVNIFTYKVVSNNLTGKIDREEVKIATAVISNQLGKSYAWIIFEKTEDAKKVKIGDFIRVHFEKGSFENFGDILG